MKVTSFKTTNAKRLGVSNVKLIQSDDESVVNMDNNNCFTA